MALSRYGGITGSKKISEDFENINSAFNAVAAEADTNKSTMDTHIANGNLHTTAAEKTKLAGIATAAGTAGSATDTVIGSRTATESVTPSLTGTITALFSSLFTLIKGITGKSSSLTAPAITLESTKTHVDDTTVHITAAERTAWNAKVDKVTGKQLSTEDYTSTEKTKLAGIATGAEVNQNAFGTVSVSGQSDIVADAKIDTLTLAAGTGITITTNPDTDTLTVTATGSATPGAHASSHLTGASDPIPVATTTTPGLMAAADKTDIATIKTSLGNVNLTQTLGPGLSVVTADANGSELDAVVYGMTRNNLIGSAKSLSGWAVSGTVELSTTVKRSGTSSIKFTTSSGNSYLARDFSVPLDTTKTYFLGFWAYVESFTQVSGGAATVTLRDVGASTIRYGTGPNTSTTGQWQFLYVKVPTANTLVGTGFRMMLGLVGSSTGVLYLDDIRLFEVTAAEYAAIGTTITTGDQFDQYFPYVDGRQHVQGVAITKQGRNLLSGSLEMVSASGLSMTEEVSTNSLTTVSTSATAPKYSSSKKYTVVPNQTYTISYKATNVSGTDNPRISVRKGSDSSGLLILSGAGNMVGSFTTGTETEILLYIYGQTSSTSAQTIRYDNIQIELGSAATAYTPAEPQSVILPVTLAQAGDVRDSVYNSGVEWMYVERVRKVTLPGSLTWTYTGSGTGFKILQATIAANVPAKSLMMKYNSLPLTYTTALSGADQYLLDAAGTALLAVSATDTGWGDSYTPSAAEILAYLYGYKMNNGTFGTAYNGSGTKTWTLIAATSNTGAVTAAPTAQATVTTSWQPYTLDYALLNASTPVTIANAEGSITLHPGGNQISVDTGAIQREKLSPLYYSSNSRYYINNIVINATTGKLANRALKILNVYKGAEIDSKWVIENHGNAYGTQEAYIATADYDSSATYYATYIAQDKYGLTANVTETAATWRTGLAGVASDLVQSVAELRQADDRQDFAIDYGEAKTDNLRIDFTAHQVDYVRQPGYAATAGTAAAYTVTLSPVPASIAEGFGITIVPHLTNTAGPTLNVNGFGAAALKDQKGVAYAAGKLIAGKPYMFRRVGTDFLADSAGGSGDAVAGDIRAGKTATTDNGDVTGTLVVQTGGTVTPSASVQTKAAGIYDTAITVAAVTVDASKLLTGTTVAGTAGTMVNHTDGVAASSVAYSGTTLGLGVPIGYYPGTTAVNVVDANFADANIRYGISMFGRTGTLTPRQYASGTGTISTGTLSYVSGGNTTNHYYATVSGLSFTPTVIVVTVTSGSYPGEGSLYLSNDPYFGVANVKNTGSINSSFVQRVWALSSNTTNMWVNSSGFQIPVSVDYITSSAFTWYAWA